MIDADMFTPSHYCRIRHWVTGSRKVNATKNSFQKHVRIFVSVDLSICPSTCLCLDQAYCLFFFLSFDADFLNLSVCLSLVQAYHLSVCPSLGVGLPSVHFVA